MTVRLDLVQRHRHAAAAQVSTPLSMPPRSGPRYPHHDRPRMCEPFGALTGAIGTEAAGNDGDGDHAAGDGELRSLHSAGAC